jgi:cysteine-rich repeat protein
MSDSGVTNDVASMRWAVDTGTVDQYGKLQVSVVQTHSWGFVFRASDVPGDHYQVHLPEGSSIWRWERYDPSFVRRVGECRGDASLAPGDWIGATITGTGVNTVVSVWRWDDDPDLGGPVDILMNWGPPTCVIDEDPQFPVDAGLRIGIRAYTGGSTAPAYADNWFGGDSPPPPVCGDGTPQYGEECDQGGETAICDVDCTFAECGDGLLNRSAGEACESDGDCATGEVCLADCSCVPEPTCGDDVQEPPEQCDDGDVQNGDGCDENCVLEECGNGVLQVGEECDDGNLDAGDGCDQFCIEEIAPPGFRDDFNRLDLGPNWVVDSLSFGILSDVLVSDSTATNQVGQMRWVGGETATVNQYGKLQVGDLQLHTWGFIFRSNGTPGEHYEVHFPPGGFEWRWERYAPDFEEQVSTCVSDSTLGGGDFLGATIEGEGTDTIVRVWRWDSDPDGGGAVNINQNWGIPTCVMMQDPIVPVDTGLTLGIRAYTGNSPTWSTADNWAGGDCGSGTYQETCGNGAPSTMILQVIDSSGAGLPDSLVDPDGLAVDADGNLFVAACGLQPQNVGVFKVTPAGEVSKIIGYDGDGAGNVLDCPVGIGTNAAGDVYVAGYLSDNVLKWAAADETVTLIADAAGDGAGKHSRRPSRPGRRFGGKRLRHGFLQRKRIQNRARGERDRNHRFER